MSHNEQLILLSSGLKLRRAALKSLVMRPHKQRAARAGSLAALPGEARFHLRPARHKLRRQANSDWPQREELEYPRNMTPDCQADWRRASGDL